MNHDFGRNIMINVWKGINEQDVGDCKKDVKEVRRKAMFIERKKDDTTEETREAIQIKLNKETAIKKE